MWKGEKCKWSSLYESIEYTHCKIDHWNILLEQVMCAKQIVLINIIHYYVKDTIKT